MFVGTKLLSQTSAILPRRTNIGSAVTRRLVRQALLHKYTFFSCLLSTSRITPCALTLKKSRNGTSSY